jgi:hypothetical protein
MPATLMYRLIVEAVASCVEDLLILTLFGEVKIKLFIIVTPFLRDSTSLD